MGTIPESLRVAPGLRSGRCEDGHGGAPISTMDPLLKKDIYTTHLLHVCLFNACLLNACLFICISLVFSWNLEAMVKELKESTSSMTSVVTPTPQEKRRTENRKEKRRERKRREKRKKKKEIKDSRRRTERRVDRVWQLAYAEECSRMMEK